MPLKDLQNHLKSLKRKVNGWAVEAIQLNKAGIVHLIKNDQLAKGLNSLDAPLAFQESNGNRGYGTYAKSTQDYADAEGVTTPKKEGDAYNFSWSGDTLGGMYLKTINKSKFTYDVYSKASKAKLLENIYGDIFDLTDENNNWINLNIIEPYIAQKIEENLLNF